MLLNWLDWWYPISFIVSFLGLLISWWAVQKWVLKLIQFCWIGVIQFQVLISSWNLLVLLMIVWAVLVIWIWVYRDLDSYPYYRGYLTWLKTLSMGVCGSYCIDFLFYLRSISWQGDIFPHVTIIYCMNMKRVTMNCPVVLFLMAVMYLAYTVSTSLWIIARSTTCVMWNTCRFLSYWCSSSFWAW